ncbi:hypothetical protein [Arthrobacter sp. AFG20]|uniref:hypothetical protein n=1 Tax=Arthrobacter sp. AFG20 TaxID=1688671 RepID=UPI000C9EA6D3|nr:hypothetical protein [Arthrobacter sp. AFG20]PNH86114.1 hypothetical protein CXZ05_03155 [Arthrobacter sp. AFG20]
MTFEQWLLLGVPFLTGGLALLGSWYGSWLGRKTEHQQWLRNQKQTAYSEFLGAFDALYLETGLPKVDDISVKYMVFDLVSKHGRLSVVSPDDVTQLSARLTDESWEMGQAARGVGPDAGERYPLRERAKATKRELVFAVRRDLSVRSRPGLRGQGAADQSNRIASQQCSGMNESMKRSWADLEPRSIEMAIQLWHQLGSQEFIGRTRFEESHRYVVIDQGQQIASKPLLAMAFQLQFACGKDGPPRLRGGEQTRTILDGLGYDLVDTLGEIAQDKASPVRIAISPSTKFWWANQSTNFEPVYDDGTLWAPLKDRRGQQVDHWRTLDSVLPGDLVFHYDSPEIRGLSRVATKPQRAYPPAVMTMC